MSEYRRLNWICKVCGQAHYGKKNNTCIHCGEMRKEGFYSITARDSKNNELPLRVDKKNDTLWLKIPKIEEGQIIRLQLSTVIEN